MILKRFVYDILGRVRSFLYGRTRAEIVCSRLKNEREVIFDFTDVERLCYKPVTVKLPGKDGAKSFDAWMNSCVLVNSGDGPETIEVYFLPANSNKFEVSRRLYEEGVEEIEE